jgi:hypothetical protein
MRIIPFPSEQPAPDQEAWTAELEAALAGELRSPSADAWRELRDDVRSLAQPIDPAFHARLQQELLPRAAVRAPTHRRRAALAGAFAVAAAVAAALVIGAPHESPVPAPAPQSSPAERSARAAKSQAAPAIAEQRRADELGPSAPSNAGRASAAGEAAAPANAGPASAPGRVQQLAASITLGTAAGEVQAISDQVAQLTVREGGYVQSSSVRVQQQGAGASSPEGEGTLSLRIPSAKLSAALAAIARLAPVRAENQSLEDITNTYEAAHRRLADALAERGALLRALAGATTEGQIDSLRERLAQAGGAISRAQASVNAVSQKASTAEVEVSVLGDAHDASAGLTLHTGLHDAGRVLLITAIVLLIACAVLVPLALALAVLLGGRSAWRRHQRERALGTS